MSERSVAVTSRVEDAFLPSFVEELRDTVPVGWGGFLFSVPRLWVVPKVTPRYFFGPDEPLSAHSGHRLNVIVGYELSGPVEDFAGLMGRRTSPEELDHLEAGLRIPSVRVSFELVPFRRYDFVATSTNSDADRKLIHQLTDGRVRRFWLFDQEEDFFQVYSSERMGRCPRNLGSIVAELEDRDSEAVRSVQKELQRWLAPGSPLAGKSGRAPR
ncbi:MAG: hypothetical protein KDA27_27560 [Candidatus Eisenbacteria bacterium]|uniref:Uncharacterized protein n=1 Tax=Eiseniibacteriota bacterium TaxID=2212470 RepID=A0A956NLW6_UNCEI|nr:hypothetical protein [Candidatus Eisenbacteria bacterium]